ncbi:MAG: hypothetical protein JXB30_01150 [Anaerolineae bacterium]|nr:hypothetical protein [Anaerolineae bacterium]
MINQLAKITKENAGQLQIVGKLEGHTAPILSIDIAPGGQSLASGSIDGTVRIWNLRTQQQVSVLTGIPEQEQIPRVAFSPSNSNHLAAAVSRKPPEWWSHIKDYVDNLNKDMWLPFRGKPVWRLWSLEEEAVTHTEEIEYAWTGPASLAYSRDGRWLAALYDVFDITTEPYTRIAQLNQQHYVDDMAFSDDSQLLALVTSYEKMPEHIGYSYVEIFQAGSWRKVAEIKGTRRISDFAGVRFLPNSHELLVRTSRDDLRGGDSHNLYHFKGGGFEESAHVLSDVACFACHPDAGMVAIARYDGRMVLLDWEQQKSVATVQAYQPAKQITIPRGVQFGPEATNRVNDAVRSLHRASADMMFSQEGKLLVSADGDRVIRIWGIPA